MTTPVNTALERLTHIAGCRGALIVDREAGVSVAAELAEGVEERALAALASSLFGRATDATRASGHGQLRVLQLEAEHGHMIVAGAGPLVVAVLTEPSAQLGLVRVQAARAAEELMR